MLMLSPVSIRLGFRTWESLLPVTSFPRPLQQALQFTRSAASQATMVALPQHTPSGLSTLQRIDPVIREILVFWEQKRRPNQEERKRLTQPALALLRQWDRLVERDGVLYRQVFRSDGAEAVLQVLLPVYLKEEVLTEVHQRHGHQGDERTLELLRQRCY